MNSLYAVTVYPIESLFKWVYLFLVSVTDSYGISLFILSLICTLVFIPLRKWTDTLGAKEKNIQDVLAPQIERIQKEFSGEKRHQMMTKLYRTYSYHPIYSLRSLVGVLSQLPFLIGAYYMLLNLEEIKSVSWCFLKNLSAPDQLLGGFPLLPFVMTVFNLLALILIPGLTKKSIKQGVGVALLFLVLLYKAPSSLLLYWSTNNFLNFLIVLYKRIKDGDLLSSLQDIYSKFKWSKEQINSFVNYLFLISVNFSIFFMFRRWGVGKSGGKFDAILGLIYLIYFIRYIVGRKNEKFKLLFTSFRSVRFALFIGTQVIFHILYNHAQATQRGLLLIILPLILSIIIKKGTFRSWKTLCFPLFSSLAVFLFHVVNNAEMLTISSVFLVLASSVVLAVILFFISWNISGYFFVVRDISLISSLVTLLWGLYPLFINASAFHQPPVMLLLIYLLFSVIILFKIFSQKRQIFLTVVISFILFSTFTIVKEGPHKLFSGEDFPSETFQLTDSMNKIEFTTTPNVYILIYDGLAQPNLFQELGIDDGGLFKLLERNGFNIYHDIYSLGSQSRVSMSSFYNLSENISLGAEKSKAIAGIGRGFQIFKARGYETINIQKIYMTSSYDYSDQLLPSRSSSGTAYFGAHTLLAGIFAGEFRFDIRPPIWFSSSGNITSSKAMILSQKPTHKRLVASHENYPSHTQNSGKCLPDERSRYNGLLKRAVNLLNTDLKALEKNDPNALIIFMSDHGAYLTGDCYMLDGYKQSEVTELMFRDRYGTFLAIKWPDKNRAKKYDSQIRTNQDVLPVVFSYLSDSKEPLNWRPKTQVIFKDKIFRK